MTIYLYNIIIDESGKCFHKVSIHLILLENEFILLSLLTVEYLYTEGERQESSNM